MTWRFIVAAVAACCLMAVVDCPDAEETTESLIQYVPLDAPAGMSQAVIVRRMPLVYTRQLFALDREGKLVGEGSADQQIEQVLANLEAVLKDSGSGLDNLIRLNVYALSTATVTSFREQLSKRLDPSVRPAITSVLTPLMHRQARVAVDAVAGAADSGEAVALKRCQSVAGDDECADAAVLPPGGIAYLSGQPAEGGLTMLPTTKSMMSLMKTLGHLKLSPQHVVQVKVFLKPVTSAEDILREVRKFFPDQITPPVVFVEWLASMPVEIEMIAQLPLSGKPAENVEYFTPPEVRPSNTFSKVALMRAERQIYISGLYARKPSRGEPQAKYLFEQLDEILTKTGSDMRHLVKATYYVSDNDAARWVDRTRPRIYDPMRPPAASKLMVHGVGQAGRTMTVDMIAVGDRQPVR
ncbi:MAG: RidA family protein [Candidatus Nealsonbacteria bacterium]|nr:RidA family protein [Candidatus Nealsonbacteria bacterium]